MTRPLSASSVFSKKIISGRPAPKVFPAISKRSGDLGANVPAAADG